MRNTFAVFGIIQNQTKLRCHRLDSRAIVHFALDGLCMIFGIRHCSHLAPRDEMREVGPFDLPIRKIVRTSCCCGSAGRGGLVGLIGVPARVSSRGARGLQTERTCPTCPPKDRRTRPLWFARRGSIGGDDFGVEIVVAGLTDRGSMGGIVRYFLRQLVAGGVNLVVWSQFCGALQLR